MKKFFLIIFVFVISIVLYGFFINTNSFKIVSKNINIESIEDSFDGFKILQLSDFLIKSKKDLDRIEQISLKVNDLKPDIIVFNGDLLYKKNSLSNDDINKLIGILKNMDCTLYKYAVIGDNDDINEYSEIMNKADFKILDNESSYIFYKDVKPMKITGLSNLDNISKAINMDDNLDTTLNVVITHYPDYFETLKNEDIDIVFAGHSLNGQVVLPFYGGIIKNSEAKKYVYGSYEENNSKLFISGGVGTNKINFRLFNKPEINLYKLKKQ